MINHIRTITSGTNYPYFNLALEKYLFDTMDDRTLILYFWQNDKTVLLGSNQNPSKDIPLRQLVEDGGFPARRLSGGGAWYQDQGTLNYSILTHAGNYDIERQLDLILSACRSLGIPAARGWMAGNSISPGKDIPYDTGHFHDLTAESRTFASYAAYSYGVRRMHHGTILISTDLDERRDYMSSDQVCSRPAGLVTDSAAKDPCYANLAEYLPGLTADELSDSIRQAFEHAFGLEAEPITYEELDRAILLSYEKIFQDDEWVYGKPVEKTVCLEHSFPWGSFSLEADVRDGMIREAVIWSDTYEGELITTISKKLRRIPYTRRAVVEAVSSCQVSERQNEIISDICKLICAESDVQ